MKKQRWKREENRNNERDERKISGEKGIIIFFFVLQYCYNAIIPLELHCSNITKKFAILEFRVLDAEHIGATNAKFYLHLAFAFPSANAQCGCSCSIQLYR